MALQSKSFASFFEIFLSLFECTNDSRGSSKNFNKIDSHIVIKNKFSRLRNKENIKGDSDFQIGKGRRVRVTPPR